MRTAGQRGMSVRQSMCARILQMRIQSACVDGCACRQALDAGTAEHLSPPVPADKPAREPAPPRHPVVVPLDLATPVPSSQIGSVPSIRAELTAAFQLALGKAFPTAQAQAIVTPTAERDAKFGDYQCNNAMALFGKLKGQASPAACPVPAQCLLSSSMLRGRPGLAVPGPAASQPAH